MFALYEELFMIAVDDERGEVNSATTLSIQYGLAGAILADLALHHRICVEGSRLVDLDATPVNDDRLDEALGLILASQKLRKPSYWLNVLAVKKMVRLVAEGLAARGVLTIHDKHYRWVVPYEAYSQQQASAKYWVKSELRAVVLGGAKAEPGTVALLSLIKACDLLNLVFTRDERKAAAKKVDELVQIETFGETVATTLAEIEMAAAAIVLDTES